jgi:hypothetical protein
LNIWLLVLVALCGVSLWFGKELVLPAQDPSGSEHPQVAPEPYELPADAAAVHLVVLNGTGEDGLARDVSLLLGRAGCVAERVGNAPRVKYAESFLVNRRLSDDRARDLAARLGGVKVLREWDDRCGEDAALVLGGDWARLKAALEKSGRGEGP